MKAVALREADKEYYAHEVAWLSVMAGSKVKAGKDKLRYKFDTFDKFFDREKVIGQVLNPKREKSIFKGIEKILRKNKRKEGE